MRIRNDGLPVLLGFVCKDGIRIKAWCEFCRKFHNHGIGNILEHGYVPTHRTAHCAARPRPFDSYYIKLVKPGEIEKICK